MSQSTFPFTPGGVRPSTEPTPEPEGKNNSLVLLLVGLAAVLALGVAAYFLFFSGDDSAEPVVSGTPATQPSVSAPGPQPSPSPSGPATLPTKSSGAVANAATKDPFNPLREDSSSTAGTDENGNPVGDGTTGTGTGTSTGAETGTGTGTSTGTGTDPGTGTGTSVGTGATPSQPQPSDGHSFTVVKVAPDQATVDVRVDKKVYKGLKAGQVFGTYFKVRLIGATGSAFQLGDEVFNVTGLSTISLSY